MEKHKKLGIETADITQAFFDEIRDMAERSYNGVKSGDGEAKKRAAITSIILNSKIKATEAIPTAAAYFEVSSGVARPVILVNVDFYSKMKSWGNKHFGLLVHEVFHCIMGHFSRFNNPTDQNEKQLLNIALDCAINQLITEFAGFNPDDAEWQAIQSATKSGERFNCVNYHTFCRMFKLSESEVEKSREAEYYYKLAQQNKDKLPQKPQGGKGGQGDGEEKPMQGSGDPFGQGESHDTHFDLNDKELTPEEVEAVKQYLKKQFTLHGVKASDFGIDDLQTGVIRWKAILRQFVARAVKADSRKTRSRPNRRHGFSVAKRVYDRKPEIAFLADSSGSMVTDFPIMANEVFSLCRETGLSSVDVYYIDTELYEKGTYKRGQSFPPIQGGGGTAFTQGLNALAKKLKSGQSVIFFTDTYTSDWPERKPPFPMLIIATEKAYTQGMPEWAQRMVIDASDLMAEAREKLAA